MQERVETIAASKVPGVRQHKGDLTGALPLSVGYSAAAFSVLGYQR